MPEIRLIRCRSAWSVEATAVAAVLGTETWSGTSFPSEKSSSAGSTATGSSRQNSKSPQDSSGSGSGSPSTSNSGCSTCGGLATPLSSVFGCGDGLWNAASDLEHSSSGLNDTPGASQPHGGQEGGGKLSGDMPMLLTQADAIDGDHAIGGVGSVLWGRSEGISATRQMKRPLL